MKIAIRRPLSSLFNEIHLLHARAIFRHSFFVAGVARSFQMLIGRIWIEAAAWYINALGTALSSRAPSSLGPAHWSIFFSLRGAFVRCPCWVRREWRMQFTWLYLYYTAAHSKEEHHVDICQLPAFLGTCPPSFDENPFFCPAIKVLRWRHRAPSRSQGTLLAWIEDNMWQNDCSAVVQGSS